MKINAKSLSSPQINKIFSILVLFWSALIVALIGWNYWQSSSSMLMLVKSEAYNSFKKDLVYRRWATMHGGVYVPITPETPPNPYLSHIPDRDISTLSGKKLTLMNPAYMTRQVHDLGEKDYGLMGHITSLKPIRPENAPDEWERKVLQGFEKNQNAVSALTTIDNKKYFRLMHPMITESGCLKCHASQGYKVGDVRGGISVSMSWEPFQKALWANHSVDILAYGGIWIIGMLGFRFVKKRLQEYMSERKQVEEKLKEEHSQLQKALNEVKTLRGIVPICSYCKQIRDDSGYWSQVEQYVSDHTDAKFSHGICPACFETEMKEIRGET